MTELRFRVWREGSRRAVGMHQDTSPTASQHPKLAELTVAAATSAVPRGEELGGHVFPQGVILASHLLQRLATHQPVR